MELERNATRDQVWLRAFFMGPTGAGKSKGALSLAAELARIFGDLPITLINTEKGRGKLYADRFGFDYIGLEDEEDQGPETWIRAFDLAEAEHPGGIIIADSASHEWMGRNGVLQRADRFGDWKKVRPQHTTFVERISALESHFICCVRASMKYEVTEEDRPGGNGKRQVVTMLGVGPVQDKDLQYEFNLVGRFELATHEVSFSGHVDPLVDTVHDLDEDAADVAEALSRWLSEGNPILPPEAADEGEIAKLRASLDAEGISAERIEAGFAAARRQNRGQLHPVYVAEQLGKSEERLGAKHGPTESGPAADEPHVE